MPNYRKSHFDPETLRPGRFTRVREGAPEDWAYDSGIGTPDAPGRHFVFAESAVLALNVALATGRPLLVSGEPGSGKTSLGRFAAHALERPLYRETVTSRTQAGTLQSSFDTLRRLSDAQVKDRLKPDQAYVSPGILWWALQPHTAAQRGLAAIDPVWKVPPLADPAVGGLPDRPPVLLLDEIDKADPDVPNDLLEALDERSFTVPETGERITAGNRALLIVMTTNNEREMPPAFLRRCVTLALPPPTTEWLVDIAQRRFGAGKGAFQDPLYKTLAQAVIDQRAVEREANRRPPSTSEFVDAVAACRELLDEGSIADDAALKSLLAAAPRNSTALDGDDAQA